MTVEKNDDQSIDDMGQAFAELVNGDDKTLSDANDNNGNANNEEDKSSNNLATGNQDESRSIDDDKQDNVWANAPDELREQFDSLQEQNSKLKGDLNANSGRVSALTKKLDAARAVQDSVAGKMDLSSIKGKNLDEIREDFPEFAEFVQDFTGQALTQQQRMIQDEIAPIKAAFNIQQQEASEELASIQRNSFSQAHPDHAEINESPEFWQWFDNQPQSVQALRTTSAADNIAMLDLYKANNATNNNGSTSRNNLAHYVETPKKGSGRAKGSADALAISDPGKYFEMITQGKT